MIRVTEMVKHLLIINALMFVGSILVPTLNIWMPLWLPENPNFHPWQLFTYMFMHGGLMHILFNMLALYSFGSALEYQWGSKKFLFFYISCGLGAALLHLGVSEWQYHHLLDQMQGQLSASDVQALLTEGKYDTRLLDVMRTADLESFYSVYNGPTVGASGAIYGLLTAFAFLYPNAQLGLLFVPVPVAAKYFVPGLLALDLFMGLRGASIFGGGGTGVAHFAHLGGALLGFIMMWYWKKNQFNSNRWN